MNHDVGAVAGENDLVPLRATLSDPEYTRFIDLGAPSGTSRVRMYRYSNRLEPLPPPWYFEAEELPVTAWVEGVSPSAAARDVTLRARRASCEDKVRVTVGPRYDAVEIQYKTFIAAAALAVPNIFEDQYYAGDYRSFGYGTTLSSRSVQSTTMTADPAVPNGQVGGPTQFFGGTVGFDDDPDGTDITTGPGYPCAAWTLYPLPAGTPNCSLTAIAGVGSNVLSMLPSRVSPTEVKVDITLSGANPCKNQEVVPAIDAHLHVHLRQVCQNGNLGPPQFRLYGTHDGFPWHELYINHVAVYKHDVCLTQETPWSLGGDEEWNFEDLSPTHSPYDGNVNLPLDQWRTVPGYGP